jgi:hypothetical protein
MPTQVDTPSNTGSYNQWGLWGAAPNKMQAVATNDGDTSIVYAASGGREVIDQYVFPLLAAIVDPVTSASITAWTRMYLKGAGGRGYSLRWNGVEVGANRQQEVRLAFPNYIEVTYSAAGAELTLAAANGQHGMKFNAAGGPSNKAEYWVTHLYRTVSFDYLTSDAGEFAHIIGSIAGAVMGSGLLFREMPALARYIWRKRGFLIHPGEYELAWRAWRG